MHFRHPALLVKAVTTLDVLSGGRAWLGIGSGHYEEFLAQQERAHAARIEEEMRLLHPISRVGRPEEVATAVAHLLGRCEFC